MLKNKKAGFTLIELLVVVAIIAIMALLGYFFTSKGTVRARDMRRKSDLRQIKTALELYHNVFNVYPVHDNVGRIKGCKEGTTFPAPSGGFPTICMMRPCACPWGEAWIDTSGATGSGMFGGSEGTDVTFMKTLPEDPKKDRNYYYLWVDNYNFCLRAILESKDDESALESQSQCGNCTFPDAALEDYHYVVCND